MEYSTKVQKKWHKYMKMIFCCCFSLFISTTGLVAQIPTNGLIAWYPLNNNANDSSGNGYNGTVNATTPAADRFGNQGKAFTFNGVNSSITTGISLLNNLTGLTATGWINPTALGTRIGFFGQNDLFEFGFLDTTNMDAWLDRINKGVLVPTNGMLNSWHMVSATADLDSLRFYVDGVIMESTALEVTSFGSINYDFNIGGGGIFDPTGNYFSGSIDDIRIYNRALTQAEIDTLFHEGGWDSTTTGVEEKTSLIPQFFKLYQAYPNPFNPVTNISFQLDKPTNISLVVYDITGKLIKTIFDNQKFSGYTTTQWNGTDKFQNQVSSGVYIYTLKSSEFNISKKMILIK